MKAMKRIATGLLAIGMMLSVAACGGGEEKTVVMTTTESMSGVSMKDTWTLNAKGDKLQTTQEVIEIDLSSYDDEQKEAFIATIYNGFAASYDALDAVTIKDNTTDTTYTLDITIDYTGDKGALEDAGLIDSGVGYVSLKKTQESLESQGYSVVE